MSNENSNVQSLRRIYDINLEIIERIFQACFCDFELKIILDNATKTKAGVGVSLHIGFPSLLPLLPLPLAHQIQSMAHAKLASDWQPHR